jgi:8-oxo-dGTP pyrophosphatase MutT (NUDIX family)
VGYVEGLRALVGQRPLVLVSAGVLAFDTRGRLLLHRRADDGYWDMPGGCLEPGETLEEAARREVREETGVELGALTLLRVLSGPELFRRYPNGDEAYHVAAVYEARNVWGILSPGAGEAVEVGFYPLGALPQPVAPSLEYVMAQCQAGRG